MQKHITIRSLKVEVTLDVDVGAAYAAALVSVLFAHNAQKIQWKPKPKQ